MRLQPSADRVGHAPRCRQQRLVQCRGRIPGRAGPGDNSQVYSPAGVDPLQCAAQRDPALQLARRGQNAGIASRGLSVADTNPEEVDKLFAVHAAGPHRLSRLALPQLRTHARSDIIIISSIATLGHAANGAPYNMAKAAGEALALTLAKEEVRTGVRVNIVAPSLTVSDMGEKLSRAITGQDDIHHLDAKFPFGRVPDPADVAAAVLWFVSDANPYCSGQKLNIDGAGQATFR